jgi:hypothetical protein
MSTSAFRVRRRRPADTRSLARSSPGLGTLKVGRTTVRMTQQDASYLPDNEAAVYGVPADPLTWNCGTHCRSQILGGTICPQVKRYAFTFLAQPMF